MRKAARKLAILNEERSNAVPAPVSPFSSNHGKDIDHIGVQSPSHSRSFFLNKHPTFSNHERPTSNELTFCAAVMKLNTTVSTCSLPSSLLSVPTCSLPSSLLSSPTKRYLYSPEVKSRGHVSPLPQTGRMRCKLLRPPPIVLRPSTSEVGVQTSCPEELPVAGASYENDISLHMTQ